MDGKGSYPYPPTNPPDYNPTAPGYNPNAPGYNPNAPGYNPNAPGYNPNANLGFNLNPNQPAPGFNPNPTMYSQGAQGYVPNPPGYGPGPAHPQGTQAYHVSSTSVMVTSGMVDVGSDHPYSTSCPHCRAQVVTLVERKPGALTFILCSLMAFFGLICGCCLIPFCINGTKDTIHMCPQCKAYIGRYSRL